MKNASVTAGMAHVDLGKDPAVNIVQDLDIHFAGWLVALVGVLVSQRGASDQTMAPSGVTLPRITGKDTILIGAQLAAPIRSALTRVLGVHFAALSSKVDGDGKSESVAGIPIALATQVGFDLYLAGAPNATNSWRRQVNGDDYEPGMDDSLKFDPQLVIQCRELVDYYQQVINASSQAIISCGTDADSVCQSINIAAFFTACSRVCSQLDAMNELAPASYVDAIKSAWDATTAKVGQMTDQAAALAGNVAAKIAGEAGSAAGAAVNAFFHEAGPMALAVAAIVAFIAFR